MPSNLQAPGPMTTSVDEVGVQGVTSPESGYGGKGDSEDVTSSKVDGDVGLGGAAVVIGVSEVLGDGEDTSASLSSSSFSSDSSVTPGFGFPGLGVTSGPTVAGLPGSGLSVDGLSVSSSSGSFSSFSVDVDGLLVDGVTSAVTAVTGASVDTAVGGLSVTAGPSVRREGSVAPGPSVTSNPSVATEASVMTSTSLTWGLVVVISSTSIGTSVTSSGFSVAVEGTVATDSSTPYTPSVARDASVTKCSFSVDSSVTTAETGIVVGGPTAPGAEVAGDSVGAVTKLSSVMGASVSVSSVITGTDGSAAVKMKFVTLFNHRKVIQNSKFQILKKITKMLQSSE